MNLSPLEEQMLNSGANFENFWIDWLDGRDLTDPQLSTYLYQATAEIIRRVLTTDDYLDVRQAMKFYLS